MWFPSRQKHRPRSTPRFRPCLETLEDRCLLSGGVLDQTFGTGGIVTTSGGWSAVNPNAVATYPRAGTANDGKIVTTGQVSTSNGKSYFDFIRYNLDGSLDRSFGGTGQVANSSGNVGNDVAVQPDGKIVGAGFALSAKTGDDFAVVRYNADGSLDTTFGGKGGTAITDVNQKSTDMGRRVALQKDGKIVVAGTTTPSGVNIGVSADLALVRYNPDGSLDTSFGAGGKVIQHFASPLVAGGSGLFLDMAIDPGSSPADPNTGKVVVVAELGSDRGTVLARFNTNGSLDTSFGSGAGYVTFSTVATGVSAAVQTDDRIVVAWANLGLARLNADGTPDLSFASGGFAPLPNNSVARSVMIQADGKILAAGYQGGAPRNFMVARYNPADGSLDTSFGVNGVAVATGVQLGTGLVRAALEPDGRIVVAGSAGANSFALARFLDAGPQIGSFTASPNPVMEGSSLTLTVLNITDLNPNSTVTQVAFYLDSNGDGLLDAGDALLASGSPTGTGAWTFTFSTAGLTSGTYTLFAQAQDNYGVFGDPVATTETVS